MTRRRGALEQTRRGLYLTQRGIGDGQVAARGPGKLAKRLARRSAVRALLRRLPI